MARSVARFRDAIRTGGNLLYMMSETEWPEVEVARLADVIGRRPGNRLVLLTVQAEASERSCAVSDAEGPDGPCLRVDIRTLTRSSGARFRDPGDDAYLGHVLRDVAARLAPAERARAS